MPFIDKSYSDIIRNNTLLTKKQEINLSRQAKKGKKGKKSDSGKKKRKKRKKNKEEKDADDMSTDEEEGPVAGGYLL